MQFWLNWLENIWNKNLSGKLIDETLKKYIVNGKLILESKMENIRNDNDLPECIMKWGWKYHHIGIPTDKVMPNERYLPHLKFYVSGFNTSPFGIEWMKFDKDCPISDIIKSVPHIAFEVEDIDKEFAKHNFEIISESGIPSDGVRSTMILHNGAPVELIEFKK